jgi:hypothetical protein
MEWSLETWPNDKHGVISTRSYKTQRGVSGTAGKLADVTARVLAIELAIFGIMEKGIQRRLDKMDVIAKQACN